MFEYTVMSECTDYSAGSQESEGFQTVASACVLCQPTIAGPSISIVNVHKFGT